MPETASKLNHKPLSGFTLLELSIVLVIIGLVVGGVLVGQDLIKAAGVRAQISQIDSYRTAISTFRLKFNALPGDIAEPNATGFGLAARGTLAGQGDGNGLLEGVQPGPVSAGYYVANGENAALWVDLSAASLIGSSFTAGIPTATPADDATGATVSRYFPAAKLGGGNYIYSFSSAGINLLGLAGITGFSSGYAVSQPKLSVNDAYAIDSKVDDGLPQAGLVQAGFVWGVEGSGVGIYYVGDYDPADFGNGIFAYGPVKPGSGVATAGSASTCYDNNNVADAPEKYSTAQAKGFGLNCALSFRL